MPIMRNPFRKQDENVRPATADPAVLKVPSSNGTKAIEIRESKQPTEYKLSEINDSGVFLPPSPPQRKGFWSTNSSRSVTSSVHRCAFDENEQFNISRESFDSYRRSFDISARSPVITQDQRPGRASLDSRPFERVLPRASLEHRGLNAPPPRSSNSFQRPSQVPAETAEEADAFEDVDIAEPKPQPPKKRGIFARMVDGVDLHHGERPASSGSDVNKSSWHHFGSRRRGQSGQGSELGAVPKRETTPKPSEVQMKKEPERSRPDASNDAQDETMPQPEPRQKQAQPQPGSAATSGREQGTTESARAVVPTPRSNEISQAPEAKAVES